MFADYPGEIHRPDENLELRKGWRSTEHLMSWTLCDVPCEGFRGSTLGLLQKLGLFCLSGSLSVIPAL